MDGGLAFDSPEYILPIYSPVRPLYRYRSRPCAELCCFSTVLLFCHCFALGSSTKCQRHSSWFPGRVQSNPFLGRHPGNDDLAPIFCIFVHRRQSDVNYHPLKDAVFSTPWPREINSGSLYEAFPPDKAKALWDRFEFTYTQIMAVG